MGAWFPHGEVNPDLSLERAASLPLDYVGMHGVGFEPTRFTTPGLKSGSLDHSDNRAFSLNSLEIYSDLAITTNVVHTTIYKQHTNLYIQYIQTNMQGRIRTYDIIRRRPDALDHSATRIGSAPGN